MKAGGRKSVVLLAAMISTLGALYFTALASGSCATLIADCFSRCSGPTPHGIYCSAGEIGDSPAENPIEITQPGLRQVQVNAKIGWDFATVMRAFLRADPDVIMVG